MRGNGSSIGTSRTMRPGRDDMTTHPRREEHRLVDRVRDEGDRERAPAPELRDLAVQPVAGDLVERAERLVHQQQVRTRSRARGRSRRASACRPKARADSAARTARARRARAPRRPPGRRSARSARARSSGRRTLRCTRDQGISVASWKTIASVRPGRPTASKPSPHQRICPAEGGASPAIIRSSVDLPQPDGPSMVTNSPAPIARSTRVERARAVRIGLRDGDELDDRRFSGGGRDRADRCAVLDDVHPGILGRRRRPRPSLEQSRRTGAVRIAARVHGAGAGCADLERSRGQRSRPPRRSWLRGRQITVIRGSSF